MGLTDIIWLLGIIAGTAWLLRRGFRSGKGGCVGCSASNCPGAKRR